MVIRRFVLAPTRARDSHLLTFKITKKSKKRATTRLTWLQFLCYLSISKKTLRKDWTTMTDRCVLCLKYLIRVGVLLCVIFNSNCLLHLLISGISRIYPISLHPFPTLPDPIQIIRLWRGGGEGFLGLALTTFNKPRLSPRLYPRWGVVRSRSRLRFVQIVFT